MIATFGSTSEYSSALAPSSAWFSASVISDIDEATSPRALSNALHCFLIAGVIAVAPSFFSSAASVTAALATSSSFCLTIALSSL